MLALSVNSPVTNKSVHQNVYRKAAGTLSKFVVVREKLGVLTRDYLSGENLPGPLQSRLSLQPDPNTAAGRAAAIPHIKVFHPPSERCA